MKYSKDWPSSQQHPYYHGTQHSHKHYILRHLQCQCQRCILWVSLQCSNDQRLLRNVGECWKSEFKNFICNCYLRIQYAYAPSYRLALTVWFPFAWSNTTAMSYCPWRAAWCRGNLHDGIKANGSWLIILHIETHISRLFSASVDALWANRFTVRFSLP